MDKKKDAPNPKDIAAIQAVEPMNPQVAAGLPGVPALPGVPPPSPMNAQLISAIMAAKAKQVPQPMCEGGKIDKPTTEAPHKMPEGPSDAEKKELVHKALKEKTLKLDDGGVVDPNAASTTLPADAPQPSKLQAILQAIGMAGKDAVSSVLPGTQSLAGAIAPASANVAATPGIAPAINAVAGSNLQDSPPDPTPVSMNSVPAAVPPMSPADLPKPQPATSQGASAPDPLSQLGKFDPSTVAPGMNPGDRQALAGQLNANQHTFGNYLAQALSGIGDAMAAKGGVQQNSLGDIINLQKQQRDEALGNFDKAREMAVQNFALKNQADQDLINNVKARGETLVSPQIAASLGHPEWGNKPIAQVGLALSAQKNVLDYTNNLMQRKQAALKDSADSVDQALKTGGIGGTQKMMDPQSRLRLVYSNAIQNDPEAFGYNVSPAGK